MELKHNMIRNEGENGFWNRMKARAASVWGKAKDKTVYALAGAAVIATLSGNPGCGRPLGIYERPDAAAQVDGSTPDASVDSGAHDSGPEPYS